MKTKISLGILLAFGLLSIKLFINSPSDKITVVAFYNQYACGDDNIDMKVQSVDNHKYNFLIDRDVAPVTNFLTHASLIDFVAEKTLMWQKGQSGDFLENFTLVGHLRDPSIKECTASKEFVVEKIKYGAEKEYREF